MLRGILLHHLIMTPRFQELIIRLHRNTTVVRNRCMVGCHPRTTFLLQRVIMDSDVDELHHFSFQLSFLHRCKILHVIVPHLPVHFCIYLVRIPKQEEGKIRLCMFCFFCFMPYSGRITTNKLHAIECELQLFSPISLFLYRPFPLFYLARQLLLSLTLFFICSWNHFHQ